MIHVAPPFDEASHRYLRPDGVPYTSSVTGTLKDAGFYDDAYFTEFGRDRGTLVHRIIEFDNLGDLDEASVDPVLAPYLEAWRRFKADQQFVIASVGGQYAVERRYGDDVLDIAGTVDAIGFTKTGALAVVDAKSGVYMPWHPIQLAAYADFVLRSADFPNVVRVQRIGVYITSDGKYEMRTYSDRADLKVWQAAVVVAQWRRLHGQARRKAA